MNEVTGICKECFRWEQDCDCPHGNSRIYYPSVDHASIESPILVQHIVGILNNNNLALLDIDLKKANTANLENQFLIRLQNQLLILFVRFQEIDKFPDKADFFYKNGQCPWLHWKPL